MLRKIVETLVVWAQTHLELESAGAVFDFRLQYDIAQHLLARFLFSRRLSICLAAASGRTPAGCVIRSGVS